MRGRSNREWEKEVAEEVGTTSASAALISNCAGSLGCLSLVLTDLFSSDRNPACRYFYFTHLLDERLLRRKMTTFATTEHASSCTFFSKQTGEEISKKIMQPLRKGSGGVFNFAPASAAYVESSHACSETPPTLAMSPSDNLRDYKTRHLPIHTLGKSFSIHLSIPAKWVLQASQPGSLRPSRAWHSTASPNWESLTLSYLKLLAVSRQLRLLSCTLTCKCSTKPQPMQQPILLRP